MTTIRIVTPPNANQVAMSRITTPATARRSIERGIRQRRTLRVSSAGSPVDGAAGWLAVGSVPGAAREAAWVADGAFDLGSVHRIAAMKTNVPALIRNARPISPEARSSPASPGPTIQAELSSVA